jgi:hypothetical protein
MRRGTIDLTGSEKILYPLVYDSTGRFTYLEQSEHSKRPNFKYLPLDFPFWFLFAFCRSPTKHIHE